MTLGGDATSSRSHLSFGDVNIQTFERCTFTGLARSRETTRRGTVVTVDTANVERRNRCSGVATMLPIPQSVQLSSIGA